MSGYGRPSLEQAMVNYRKVARAAIRLRHSVAADNELNAVMPAIERWLEAQAQQGSIPAASFRTVEVLIDNENRELE